MISSRQHEIVRTFRRVAQGDATLAVIDGWHLLREAVTSGVPLTDIALVENRLPPSFQGVLDEAHRQGTRIVTVSASVMDALSPVRTPSGVAALARRRDVGWTSLLDGTAPLIVMAVGLQDPGNAGALVRAAEAGGATGVLLAGAAADPWGWKALRAAMGSTFRLPVMTVSDAAAACLELRDAGVRLLATTPRGGRSMYEANLRPPTAFILGGEGPGLDDELAAYADDTVTIPMRPPVESLNVAVAAALLVYETARQRGD